MNTKHHLALAILGLGLSMPVMANTKKPLQWQIKNTVWTKGHEKAYEEFIATLGKAKKAGVCHTTNDCIKSPVANPKYYNLNPSGLNDVYSDCADLPYVLRAYFSWMNDLPFSFPIALTQNYPDTPENQALSEELKEVYKEYYNAGFFKKKILEGKIKDIKKKLYGNSKTNDIRYNRYGNIINDKRYIKNGENVNRVLVDVVGAISTASFRTDGSSNETGKNFRDTYPVAVSREAIKAGTVLYDPNGHIAVVYEVTSNGKIHLIDAHPDNSLTAITYGEKFSQTQSYIGGGFSNWRPFSYEDGNVEATRNENLSDYSLEQFNPGKLYSFNGENMKFHEYVRNKLTQGSLVYNPITELKEVLEEICYDVKERETAVNISLKAGLQNQNHPDLLPANIYGTDGDWENYSSPSRDARLKASVREARELMIKLIEGYSKGLKNISYSGIDLKGDLDKTYREVTNKCKLSITKTNGQEQTLNLDQILSSIYALSFDPYHCVELRWGLTDSESLASCNQSANKLEWYRAEQGLRNRIERDYSMKMDYSLKELPGAPISKVKQENVSIKELFIQ